jgi:hypothetical protein
VPQLHLYLPEKDAKAIRAKAKARGVPVSRYLAEIVTRELHRGWPEGFFDRVCGGWKGAGIERPSELPWEEREPLA